MTKKISLKRKYAFITLELTNLRFIGLQLRSWVLECVQIFKNKKINIKTFKIKKVISAFYFLRVIFVIKVKKLFNRIALLYFPFPT